MRFRPMSVLLAAVLAVGGATPALAEPSPTVLVDDPTAYVDPLIGTKNAGNVFPGAVTPFGMFSFSPENTRGDATRTAAPGGYHYDATRIRGFSLTHMSGTGCAGGSGDIPLFPYPGEVTSSPVSDTKDQVYAADFSHADETAEPGHYRVGLASGVTAFVGSAVNGSRQSEATVTYTDGGTEVIPLGFTDWTLGGGSGGIQYGNEVVARAAYRNVAGADRDPVATYVFATRPFTAPEGRTIASVRLPKDGNLHVFTPALD